MKKVDALDKVLGEIVIYGGEDGDIEWTLKEIEEDAPWDIRYIIVKYLNDLRVDVPRPVFGDDTAIKAAIRNKVIDELTEILEEGGL